MRSSWEFYRWQRPGSRIGLLGGSFNPPHQGHLHIAARAQKILNLDQVWWLVSPQNPLKSTQGMAALQQRKMWCQKLITGHNRMRVLDIETHMATCYSSETAQHLSKRYPRQNFVWIMGADSFAQLPKWHDWKSLLRTLPVCVIDRPGYGLATLCSEVAQKFPHRRVKPGKIWSGKPVIWCFDRYRPTSLSSTKIRQNAWTY